MAYKDFDKDIVKISDLENEIVQMINKIPRKDIHNKVLQSDL